MHKALSAITKCYFSRSLFLFVAAAILEKVGEPNIKLQMVGI